MIITGLIAAFGLLFLCFKFGFKKVINYDVFFDVFITAVLLYTFQGTYSGMAAAMFGGLVVSVLLFALKRVLPHERLSLMRTHKFPYRKIGWVEVVP